MCLFCSVPHQPTPPEPPPESPEAHPPSIGAQTAVDRPGAHTQHYRDVLCELVDIGIDLARMYLVHARLQHQTVEAGAHPLAPIDFSVPYESIARSIRRTVALARKLDQPVTTDRSRAASRRQIIREVEDAIERQPSDTPRENLHEELRTRLDAPDLEDDIGSRPVAEIIADICHDLGLDHAPGSPPWKRRTSEDIERLYARASQPPRHSPRLRTYTGSDPPARRKERTAVLF